MVGLALTRRYVKWHTNIRDEGYEVIRRDGGDVILVGNYKFHYDAMHALDFDRARILICDQLAIEVRPHIYKVK